MPTEENTEGVGRSDDASFNAIGVLEAADAATGSLIEAGVANVVITRA